MHGCPRKAAGKAEIQAPRSAVADAQCVPRPLSTRDMGKEAQRPPWSIPRMAVSLPAPEQGRVDSKMSNKALEEQQADLFGETRL